MATAICLRYMGGSDDRRFRQTGCSLSFEEVGMLPTVCSADLWEAVRCGVVQAI